MMMTMMYIVCAVSFKTGSPTDNNCSLHDNVLESVSLKSSGNWLVSCGSFIQPGDRRETK